MDDDPPPRCLCGPHLLSPTHRLVQHGSGTPSRASSWAYHLQRCHKSDSESKIQPLLRLQVRQISKSDGGRLFEALAVAELGRIPIVGVSRSTSGESSLKVVHAVAIIWHVRELLLLIV